MKKVILFIGILAGLNSCYKTEFKIKSIPDATMYSITDSTKSKYEYFDVLTSENLSNYQWMEKLKQHVLQHLKIDTIKTYQYYRGIYYKHSYFSKYNTSRGSKWDPEGTRDPDSPDLFNTSGRKIGVVLINNYGSKFQFASFIDRSTDRLDETDSTFFSKMIQYQSKK